MTIIYQWRLSADIEMLLYLRRRPGQERGVFSPIPRRASVGPSLTLPPTAASNLFPTRPLPFSRSRPTPTPQTLGGWWARVEKSCGGPVGSRLLRTGVRVARSAAPSAVWVSWTCALTPFPLALSRSSRARGWTQGRRNGPARNQQASRFFCGYRARIWGSTLSPLFATPPPWYPGSLQTGCICMRECNAFLNIWQLVINRKADVPSSRVSCRAPLRTLGEWGRGRAGDGRGPGLPTSQVAFTRSKPAASRETSFN